jgi:hypothetical protein
LSGGKSIFDIGITIYGAKDIIQIGADIKKSKVKGAACDLQHLLIFA